MDASGIIRQLEGDPALRAQLRAVLLGDELLELPELTRQLATSVARSNELMDQLTERMDQLTERMDQLTERMDQLTARIDQLTERMDQLTARVDQLTERMDQLTARIDQLTERMDQLTARVDQLTERMDQLTVRVDQLTARVDQLAAELAALAQRFDAFVEAVDRRFEILEHDVAELKGMGFEGRLRSNPARFVPRSLARGATLMEAARIDELLDTLSEEQAAELQLADAIIEARQPDGTPIVLVVEASWGVHLDDIERAARRATMLQVAGVESRALAVSHVPPAEAVAAAASSLGVAVVSESGGLHPARPAA